MSKGKALPQSVTVDIAGEKHVIRSEAPPEYTRGVASYVDRTVRRLWASQPLERSRTTTLAALFITDELFRAREQLRALEAEVAQRAEALAETLEDALAAGHDAESTGGSAQPESEGRSGSPGSSGG